MPEYVALLRAINVPGRILKMADLRTCLTESGLTDVETHIQSGNVRFRSAMRAPAKVERHVEDTLRARCGFDVTTIVLTPAELRAVYDDAMAMDPPLEGEPRRYVTFLKDIPSAEAVAAIDAARFDGEASRVAGKTIHVWLTVPAHKAKSYNTKAHKSLVGTTRDLKVVTKLAQTWGPSDV